MGEKKNEVADKIMAACGGCRGMFQKGTLKKCARCKTSSYCGQACQLSHWKTGHKAECKPAAKTKK